MKRLFTVLFSILLVGSTYAQFTIDGQYRSRGELRHGFKKPFTDGAQPAAFIEQRARLIAGYKQEKLGFKLSVQDVRIWGEVGQINKSDNLLSVHEAYGEYYATEKSSFRVGRQAVVYDGQRFFGGLDWAMQGRALDAVRYLYKTEKSQLDLLFAWNQEGYGDGPPEPAKLAGSNYTAASGANAARIFNLPLPKNQVAAYYKTKLSKGSIAFLAVGDTYDVSDSTQTTYSNFTLGVTPDFTFGDLKLGGELYYTTGAAGKSYNGTQYKKVDMAGLMAGAYLQLTKVWSAPMLGVDYVSGDKESTTDKVEGWSPKYGTNHKFYGFMDYFYVGNGHGGGNEKSAGLIDVYLKTKFKLAENTTLLGHAHYFMAATERTKAGKTYSGALGTEIDLVLVQNLGKGIELKAGYSQMLGISETMKVLKGMSADAKISGMQNWTWVMIAFSPKLM